METSSSVTITEMDFFNINAATQIVAGNWGHEDSKVAEIDFNRGFADSSMDRPKYFVAHQDGQIVGCIGFIQSWMQFGWYEIFWVNVDKDRHGQGIGKALMRFVLDRILQNNPDAVLTTLSTELIGYYEQFGFRVDREIPNKNDSAKTDHLMSRLF